MGYGSRAIQLVQQYYQEKFGAIETTNSHKNDENGREGNTDESMEAIEVFLTFISIFLFIHLGLSIA